MAWTLLAKAAATAALTYDARLVPRDTLEITSRELERHICEAVIGLLGGELDEHAVKRLALPGALRGCGARHGRELGWQRTRSSGAHGQ